MARVQLETITHEQHKDALKLRNNTAINVRDLNMTFKWLDIGQRLVVLPDADVDWDTVEDEFHLEPVGFGGHLRRVQSPPRAYPVHGFIDAGAWRIKCSVAVRERRELVLFRNRDSYLARCIGWKNHRRGAGIDRVRLYTWLVDRYVEDEHADQPGIDELERRRNVSFQ